MKKNNIIIITAFTTTIVIKIAVKIRTVTVVNIFKKIIIILVI